MFKIGGKAGDLIDFLLRRTTSSHDLQENFREEDLIGLKSHSFPASREIKKTPEPENRSLTANMTGEIQLTGGSFNLHFEEGMLRSISYPGGIFQQTEGLTAFECSDGRISYKNESAFAFEGEGEYGLRTLQIPVQRKRGRARIITDYLFSEDSDDAVITLTAAYPAFTGGAVVRRSRLIEIPLFAAAGGILIKSDAFEQAIKIDAEDEAALKIAGRSFRICSGEREAVITFEDGDDLVDTAGLSMRTAEFCGESFLFVNPGGTYTPAGASNYSGITEKIRFRLSIK